LKNIDLTAGSRKRFQEIPRNTKLCVFPKFKTYNANKRVSIDVRIWFLVVWNHLTAIATFEMTKPYAGNCDQYTAENQSMASTFLNLTNTSRYEIVTNLN